MHINARFDTRSTTRDGKLPKLTRPRAEKRIYLSVPHMGGAELRYVQEAFDSNWLSSVGPNLAALEEAVSQRTGYPSVALASGTAGIHLALKLLGVGSGDEVITPTLTFAASCNPICYEGGRPVFIDSERESWNLDPALLTEFLTLRAAAGRLPKAVIVVHLFGQCADMDPILEVCRNYEIPVLEDAAEALGSHYRHRPAGTLGDVGVYSLNGNKIITCTAGGILVSPKSEWIEKARYWSTQARDPDPISNFVHSELGYNYRMSNVLGGIARGQLELLELRIKQRKKVFDRYCEAFADLDGIEAQPEASYGLHTRWLSCFLIDEQAFGVSSADLIRILETVNVEARPVWRPMHTQPLYQGVECLGGSVSEDLNRRGICLPSSSSLTPGEQDFVIDCIREIHTVARVA